MINDKDLELYKEPILVTRSSMPDLSEYVNEIKSLWDTHWLTNMGAKHKALALELKRYLGVESLDLMVNGHMALEMSIQALKLTGEVITTPFTFASTTHAIVRNGLKPIFCDIDPETFCIDAKRVESLITDKTSAIIPVHVYGNICDVEEIQRIANKYGLTVLYDACHAFGETIDDVGIGNFGDVSCFSFHATKVFNTIEGGAVAYKKNIYNMPMAQCENMNDYRVKSGTFAEAHGTMDDFGERLYNLKNFGIHGPERVEAVGANAKMNEFAAAMGLCNLRHIEENIIRRKGVSERYREHLEGVEGIQLSPRQERIKSNFSYFPVVFDEVKFGSTRNEVFDELAKNNIGARKYFYPLTSTFECYRADYDAGDTPVALRISKRVLTLPIYADLALEDVDRICNIVLSCKK